MKYQSKINFHILLKKCLLWFFLLLFFYFTRILILNLSYQKDISLLLLEVKKMIGCFDLRTDFVLYFLFFFYQFLLVSYYSYTYFTYEKNNNPEYTFLRFDSKKWIFLKNFISFFTVFLFKVFIAIFIGLFLQNFLDFHTFFVNLLQFSILPILISSFLVSLKDNGLLNGISIFIHLAFLFFIFSTNSILFLLILFLVLFFYSIVNCDLRYIL